MTAVREEATKLFKAYCKDGVFYLDMLGTKPGILKAMNNIYALEEDIFCVLVEERMQYEIDVLSSRRLNGYSNLQPILFHVL